MFDVVQVQTDTYLKGPFNKPKALDRWPGWFKPKRGYCSTLFKSKWTLAQRDLDKPKDPIQGRGSSNPNRYLLNIYSARFKS